MRYNMAQTKAKKKRAIEGKKYKVLYKNVFTKGIWKQDAIYPNISQAEAQAEYLRKQKYIMGKDWAGHPRPSPKTETRIEIAGS